MECDQIIFCICILNKDANDALFGSGMFSNHICYLYDGSNHSFGCLFISVIRNNFISV